MSATTANDVLAMLRRMYLPENRPAGGLFAPEIGSPDGSRRADLIWVPTSRSGAHSDNIIGHEVKVSRADVITEINDPTKADPWMRYCTRWWLVVSDPAMVDGLEVPEAWGILAPPSGRRTRSMTIIKKAPRLTPDVDLSPAMTRITAYVVHHVQGARDEARRQVKYRDEQIERMRQQMSDLRTAQEFGTSPHARRVNNILARVRSEARDVGWWANVDDDDRVVAAIVDHGAVADAARTLRYSLDSAIAALADPAKTARERLSAINTKLSEAS